MLPAVLHPRSRGSITLRSADPFDRPIIDPRLLSDSRDRDVMKVAYKYIHDLTRTRPLQDLDAYIVDERYPTRERITPDCSPLSDEYLDSYIEHMARGDYHPAGSCKMGAVGDKSAVVDPHLR